MPQSGSQVSDLAHVIQLAVAPVFLLGMLALIGGFVTFLREIFLATASLRIGPSPH